MGGHARDCSLRFGRSLERVVVVVAAAGGGWRLADGDLGGWWLVMVRRAPGGVWPFE